MALSLTLSLVATAPALTARTLPAGGDLKLLRSLVREGEQVSGVGAVTAVEAVTVNSAASWIARCDTDHPDVAQDAVLLGPGLLVLREGQPLAQPTGTALGAFGALTLDDQGQSVWIFTLDGAGSSASDEGVYWGTALQLLEGASSAAPGWSTGTAYTDWNHVQLNDQGQFLVLAGLDDPLIPSPLDRALVLGIFAPGAAPTEVIVAREGDLLPGQSTAIADFITSPLATAFADGPTVLFTVVLGGDPSQDVAVYLGGTLLAREGAPSPVSGRVWAQLGAAVVDLNDQGDWALLGQLEGESSSNTLLVRNGQKLVQEGDVLPDIAPYRITSFGSGPICLDDAGNLLWWGDWDDPDTGVDSGFFLNHELLVQEGVSTVDGLLLDTFFAVEEGYALSQDGRFFAFLAELTGGIQGAFLLAPSGASSVISGCIGNAGSLTSNEPLVGLTTTLQLDHAQAAPALTLLGISSAASLSVGCGLFLPGLGELFLDLGASEVLLSAGPNWIGSPVQLPLSVPNDAALVCQPAWLQAAFVDLLGASPAEPVRLTNGLAWEIGGAP